MLVEELRAVRVVAAANALAERQEDPMHPANVAVPHHVRKFLAGAAQRTGFAQALVD